MPQLNLNLPIRSTTLLCTLLFLALEEPQDRNDERHFYYSRDSDYWCYSDQCTFLLEALSTCSGADARRGKLTKRPESQFVYVVCTILYNTLLHPLRKYPGSVFAAATPLPLMYSRAMGQIVKWTQVQHNRYGSVVRMSPNELSFIDAEAWDNIFGHGRASKFKNVEFIKDPRLVGPDLFVKPGEPAGIMRADHSAHATQRRLLSPAFSDKALKDQEPLLQSYVDILINQWRTICDKGNATGDAVADLVLWYNFTTFDIMADLTFGEPLHMLDRGEYTPWVNALFTTFKLLMFNLVSGFSHIAGLYFRASHIYRQRLKVRHPSRHAKRFQF